MLSTSLSADTKARPRLSNILAYAGTGVPATIGARFQALAAALGIPPEQAPVLASTWASAGKAVGRAMPDAGNDKTLLLAESVMGFHFAFEAGSRREALARLHRSVLLVRGEIANAGAYSTHLSANGLEDGRWRSGIIAIGQALRLRSSETADSWLKRARALLESNLVGSSSIAQRLRSNDKLSAVLAEASPTALPAKAIHAVKGLEFAAVCVVLTVKTAGGIVDVLTGAEDRLQTRRRSPEDLCRRITRRTASGDRGAQGPRQRAEDGSRCERLHRASLGALTAAEHEDVTSGLGSDPLMAQIAQHL